MHDIRVRKGKYGIPSRRVYAYTEDGKEYGRYSSVSHAARALKCSSSSISRSISLGRSLKCGIRLYYAKNNPYLKRELTSDGIPKDMDKPVISFFKEDKQALAEYKSVTFLASCLQRDVKTVYGWLVGSVRCTDLDCYYKFKDECTEKELSNMFNIDQDGNE